MRKWTIALLLAAFCTLIRLLSFELPHLRNNNAAAPQRTLDAALTFEHKYCMLLGAADRAGSGLPEGALFATLGDVASNCAPSQPTSLVVGANKGATTGDGATTDPAFTSLMGDARFASWSKVFVEPIPSIFAALQANIAKSAGALDLAVAVNAAVSDHDARLVMYCWKLDAEGNVDYAAFSALGMTAHSWMAGTCSLSKQRLFSAYDFSFFSALSSEQERTLLQEVDVAGMTFASIMQSAGIALKTVKYLQIDAEGHDAVLLHLLPWDDNSFKPALVNFESVLLSHEDLARIETVLTEAGYILRATTHQTRLWAFSNCSASSG